ncbi:MAG: hypothetical protein OEM02_10630 [Desulfobulbaceae bacterium]|nr:hypothetical protein [Desulfobulbaceae bacterium]
MGELLTQKFDKAYKFGGLFAMFRLAMITKTPSTAAASLPDTQENLAIFETALNKLEKEMKK